MEENWWQDQHIRSMEEVDSKEWNKIASSIPEWIHLYADVFSKHMFTKLPQKRPWDHAIDLKPGASLGDCKTYPLSRPEEIALDDFLRENLHTGRIRPSKSPIASPFFFIKKKDGSLRPVQDYRKLNDASIKNRYPLPLIQELELVVPKLIEATVSCKHSWGYADYCTIWA